MRVLCGLVRVAWNFLLLSNSEGDFNWWRRRRSRTTEWAKTTKDQKAVLGEEQTDEHLSKTGEYLARLTEKERHTSAPVSRTVEESSLPHPINGPRWAVRSG